MVKSRKSKSAKLFHKPRQVDDARTVCLGEPPLNPPQGLADGKRSERELSGNAGALAAERAASCDFLLALPEVKRKITRNSSEKRFFLETRLGCGGMCEVFAARDLLRVEWGDSRPSVAVKRLKPELAENSHARLLLAQEFFTLRHLAHPGVVRVFDLHQQAWGVCFSMELLQGRTAHDALLQGGAGKPAAGLPQGMSIATSVFDALQYLHSHGVVHGDVKPANIFCTDDNRIVLFDFNVAQVTAKPGAASACIAQGLREALCLPSHSLLHASPERLRGDDPSAADDIFSACCSVYEILQGEHPFKRLTALEALERQNSGGATPGSMPEKPAELSSRQWQTLRAGLSFAATARPSASELHEVFSALPKVSAFSKLFGIS